MVVRPSRSSARAIKMPPQATFGAHLRAVRICFSAIAEKQHSYPAQPSVGGLGVLPERVLLPFARAKGSPRRIGAQAKSRKRLCDAGRRDGAKPYPTKKSPAFAGDLCLCKDFPQGGDEGIGRSGFGCPAGADAQRHGAVPTPLLINGKALL